MRLKKMVDEIDDIKKKYPDGLEQETQSLLVRLKRKDPEAYKRLLNEHREG